MSGTIDILERLIAFDTVSAKSNLPLIAYVEDFLRTRGFTVHRVEDAGGEKAGLFAAYGPQGAGVLLSAHSDVVPVAGQDWTREPFRLTDEGDKLFGRGTTDMKGYLAAMLALAERASRCELKEPIKLAISYDEEIGCVGISKMIDRLAPAIGLPRACFVGEPTEMRVAVGHKGKVAMRAVCHGENGHSALAPQYANALHLAADLVVALRGLQRSLAEEGARDDAYAIPYSTVHVGRLEGGRALNIVADRAVVDFELRYLTKDNADLLAERIAKVVERVEQSHRERFPDIRITLETVNTYPGLDLPKDAPVIAFAESISQSAGSTKVPFGTEAGYFDQLGIPTVVCGPGSMAGQGHKPDEYIERAQLAACDKMLDRLLDRLKV